MIKTTIQIGNSILRKPSKLVNITTIKFAPIKNLINNLIDSMRENELVGMAAPQIGSNLQIFVTELRKTKFRKSLKELDPLRIFINPKIISSSKEESTLYEGCGSLAHAGIFGPVRRSKKVKVSALDENGNEFTIEVVGLLAKVIQHEYDHLKGVMCIDKFTDTKKVMERNEYIQKFN